MPMPRKKINWGIVLLVAVVIILGYFATMFSSQLYQNR